jgi:hypothetical protein
MSELGGAEQYPSNAICEGDEFVKGPSDLIDTLD